MNPAIVAAIKHQNYGEADRLIAALPPDNLWKTFHQGQLHEAQEAWELAEANYRELLRLDGGPKLTLAARQGLQRLSEQAAQTQAAVHQAKLEANRAQPGQDQPGLLVIEAVPSDHKADLAADFAQIMDCDRYSARMALPSRGWRFYRSGIIAELQTFGQELQAAGIPAAWYPLTDIHPINVLQVCYLETQDDPVQAQVTAAGGGHDVYPFSWHWSEVSQRVEGLVPIFEEVVDRDRRGKLHRKEETQDHAQFFDLHLPSRNCILRFYDSAYQFHQGLKLVPDHPQTGAALDQETSWAHWRALVACIEAKRPQLRTWNDFDFFANTALDHPDTLDKIQPHINLFRRTDSHWDPAFHLYSSIIFLKSQQT